MAANNRASLLANLRTGGVRSTSSQIPQTAAPMVSTFQHLDHIPMTSVNPTFQSQMQAQAQALQMQMVQVEIMRLQAIQQAQVQLMAQQQQQQQQQQQLGRRPPSFLEPHSAAPTVSTFNRSRPSQAEQLKAQLHLNQRSISDDQPPMSAALGGKFGGRLNPYAATFRFGGSIENIDESKLAAIGPSAPASTASTPPTPASTTVISGGTPLGMLNGNHSPSIPASKSDTSVNWRRSSNNSVLGNQRAVSHNAGPKRPQPLNIASAVTIPRVSVDTSDVEDETSSGSSNRSDSSPTTPRTSSSHGSDGCPPLTPREEAAKRLYESLGIGRPSGQGAQYGNEPTYTPHQTVSVAPKVICLRQPRGPPSGADQLGAENFAARIRKQAIGGLEAMLDARVNRHEIEAY